MQNVDRFVIKILYTILVFLYSFVTETAVVQFKKLITKK